jgi:hypothetical protein
MSAPLDVATVVVLAVALASLIINALQCPQLMCLQDVDINVLYGLIGVIMAASLSLVFVF